MFWRRRFPRLSKDFQVSYRLVNQEKFENDPVCTLAINISGGGVCFETTDDLKKGALVALEIRSPDFGTPILALAKVVWCKAKGGAYTIGAEFWWIGWGDSQAQSTIANYVASHTASPVSAILG